MDNEEIMRRALAGEGLYARMYCGAYTLVYRISDNGWYRCKGDIPEGYAKVECPIVYDEDGFLKPKFWCLPKI